MKLSIIGQKAEWTETHLTVYGSEGIYKLEVDFADDPNVGAAWDDLTKKAIYKNSALADTYPDGIHADITDGEADIPAAILSAPGLLYVGVIGEASGVAMPTVWASPLAISPGCGEGQDAPPVVYDAARNAIKYGENAEVYAEGGYLVLEVEGTLDDPVLVRADEYTDGAKDYADAAALSSNFASARAKDAEAYAIGSRDGEPVTSDDPAYNNNAKYYAGQAESDASNAHADAQAAAGSASDASGYATAAGNAKTAAQSAQGHAEAAQTGAETAEGNAEAWAVGQRDGVDVPPTDPAYENNAKYYAGQAAASAAAAEAAVTGGVEKAQRLYSANNVTNIAPYIFRKSAAGNREQEKLVGATMAWNQRLNNKTIAVGTYNWSSELYNVSLIEGHKYLLATDKEQLTLRFRNTIAGIVGNTGKELIYNATASRNDYAIQADGTSTEVSNLWMTDLTKMFGSAIADYAYTLESGTAGAGIAWLRSCGFFTAPYYVYNAGSLESVCASQKKTVGFNLWDEEWELGQYNAVTGEKSVSTVKIRCKNQIPVMPNTPCYFNTAGVEMVVLFYDVSGNYIPGSSVSATNATKTTPSNAAYATFFMANAYGTTYKHDICINESKTTGTPKNGDYVPSDIHTYAIDDTKELRGLYKLDADNNLYADGDIMDGDTVTRKYGIVDLGTATWTKSTPATLNHAVFSCTSALTPARKSASLILFTGKYTESTVVGQTNVVNTYGAAVDKLTFSASSANFAIIDSAHDADDADTFKTAMSGVYMLYELATPTTESCTKYDSPQVVDADGTESFTDAKVAAGTRDVAVPVGHDTEYYTAPTSLAVPIDADDNQVATTAYVRALVAQMIADAMGA